MSPWRGAIAAIGAAMVVVDLADLVKALVVPRPQTRSLVGAVGVGLRRAVHLLASHVSSFARRDRFLSATEPVLMLVRLALWLGIGFMGFALLTWGVAGVTFGRALLDSGSSVFTLGFATAPGTVPTTVIFLAAAFGLVTVALQIAYLPALYDAFNRRETLVTLLESRAGTPAWGPELLARHHLVGIEASLPSFYEEWERWAADVAESHTTYPVLLYLRSPHPANSWVVALVSVLDSAALYLALCPERAPVEARLCVRMGFTALRDIARVLRIPFDPDPMPDAPITLTRDEFDQAVHWMQAAGVTMERGPDEAWPHFVGWRTNYEQIAYRLARAVAAPAAPWTGGRARSEEMAAIPQRPVDRRPDRPGERSLIRP